MTTLPSADFPKRATLWHDESTVLTGAARADVLDTNQRYATYSAQNPGANGDSFTQSMFLRAGTYTMAALGITGANGMIDWYIDGVLVVSGQDWYSGGAYNIVKTASVSIVTDGYHVLRGAVNGKNGLSGGYAILLTKIDFYQASD